MGPVLVHPLDGEVDEGTDATHPSGACTYRPAALAAVGPGGESAEVICIIRPLSNPRAKSEVIMLDRASPQLLQQLSSDRQAQQARHLTSLNVKGDGIQQVRR